MELKQNQKDTLTKALDFYREHLEKEKRIVMDDDYREIILTQFEIINEIKKLAGIPTE